MTCAAAVTDARADLTRVGWWSHVEACSACFAAWVRSGRPYVDPQSGACVRGRAMFTVHLTALDLNVAERMT